MVCLRIDEAEEGERIGRGGPSEHATFSDDGCYPAAIRSDVRREAGRGPEHCHCHRWDLFLAL